MFCLKKLWLLENFKQLSGILQSNGLNLESGYVRVERIRGNAPFYAYAVINDQASSDGSFVATCRRKPDVRTKWPDLACCR